MKKYKFLILFIILIIGGTVMILKNKIEGDTYFKNLSLELTGAITCIDCPENNNGFCIIDLKIISSNITDYDLRGKSNEYYCIIKNDRAEIYQCAGANIKYENGDTINIDTYKEKISLYKNGDTIKDNICGVYTDPGFFEYIKKYHPKF